MKEILPILNSPWKLVNKDRNVGDPGYGLSLIEGSWSEDNSPYFIRAPEQLVEPLIEMQKCVYEYKEMIIEKEIELKELKTIVRNMFGE